MNGSTYSRAWCLETDCNWTLEGPNEREIDRAAAKHAKDELHATGTATRPVVKEQQK